MSKFRDMLESTFTEFYNGNPSQIPFVIKVYKDSDLHDDEIYYIVDEKGEELTTTREFGLVIHGFENAQKCLYNIYKTHINRPTYDKGEVTDYTCCCFVNGEFRMYEIEEKFRP